MPPKIIYNLVDLRKSFGQLEVLKGINLSFFEGAKIGLIGANGAGKSTLLRIIAGVDTKYEGLAKPAQGAKVGYLAQEPPLNDDETVAGNLAEVIQPLHDIRDRYYALMGQLGESEAIDKEYEVLESEMHAKELWDDDDLANRLQRAADALQLPPMDERVDKLSGGERRRVALCKLLLEQPDILLLDEPTNHLDAESIEWLEHHLAEYAGTVILITHDRYFLDHVVGWMLEVERGLAQPYEGNYSAYLFAKQKQLNTKRSADSSREKQIAREREWLGKTPSARTTQSKARIARYKELLNMRADEQLETLDLRIPPGPRLGDQVIEVRDLKKSFGERTLFENLDFTIAPGDMMGVIGANGRGKTTLLKILLGKEEADEGKVTIGSTVVLRYLDQSRVILDDDKSVYDNICEGNPQIPYGGQMLDGRAYVARFNFKGEDQQKKLGQCSGGMRNRVLLAKMLREPANLLLLDEPTNDLDLETLRVLEEALQNYTGCAIIVSHDRYFLDRTTNKTLAFEGDGIVNVWEGPYEDYHAWWIQERDRRGLGQDSKAGKYRKLFD